VIVIGIEPGDVEDVYRVIIVHCREKQEDEARSLSKSRWWEVECRGYRRCDVHIDCDSMQRSLKVPPAATGLEIAEGLHLPVECHRSLLSCGGGGGGGGGGGRCSR
jgi:hypothetical protein